MAGSEHRCPMSRPPPPPRFGVRLGDVRVLLHLIPDLLDRFEMRQSFLGAGGWVVNSCRMKHLHEMAGGLLCCRDGHGRLQPMRSPPAPRPHSPQRQIATAATHLQVSDDCRCQASRSSLRQRRILGLPFVLCLTTASSLILGKGPEEHRVPSATPWHPRDVPNGRACRSPCSRPPRTAEPLREGTEFHPVVDSPQPRTRCAQPLYSGETWRPFRHRFPRKCTAVPIDVLRRGPERHRRQPLRECREPEPTPR